MGLKERAARLKTDIPALFLCLRRRETPWYAKLLAGITVAYALSPIDIIPDFIPVAGYLDDLILLPALAALTIKLIPREIFEECRAQSEGMWSNGKPKKWYYALPIIIFWLIIIFLIIKAVFLR